MRFRVSRLLLSCACLLLPLAIPLSAQFDTAEVLGTVHDASGAPVPKASVTLRNLETNIEVKTATSDTGIYDFTNVKIGKYSVAAEAAGFSQSIASDVTVNVNARQRVDLTLQVGNVKSTVEVIGAASLLESDSSENGQVINRSQVVGLPLNGRQYSDLALLANGVVRSPSAVSSTPREGSFVVNGLRSVYNNFLLDGIDNNAYGTSNQGFANEVIQPSPDAVAEFQVVTNNYSAEYGRSGGATINVATLSGTNKLHGTAYDFLRNTDLNANGFVFSLPFFKPTLQQNQFGGTVGGPILKNKVFFFADYEGFRSLQHVTNFDTIPTLTDRQGILPVAIRNPLTGILYPAGAQLPVTPFAAQVLAALPAPTGPGRSNNYQTLLLNRNYSDKFDGRIDGKINDSMSAFLRIGQRKVNIYNQPDIAGPSGGNQNGYTRVLDQQAEGSYTWITSPTSVLEARFAVSRTNAGKQPPYLGYGNALSLYGIPGLPTDPAVTGGLFPIILSGGLNQFGRQATNPQFQNPLDFDPKVNFSKNFGRQSVKIGYEFMAIRVQVLDVNPLYGKDSFAGQFSKPSATSANDAASYSLADFMFGLPSQLQLGNVSVGNYRQHEHFAYLQDDYRLSSKLTLNLGVRWEYATPLWERDNNMTNFDPATNSLIHAKSGSIYNRALVEPDYRDFAPRLGFAYNVAPKTVIRGGYAISYIHQNRVGSANLLGIKGPQVVIATINQTPATPGFLTTEQGYPAGLTSPANFNPVASNITYIPKNLRTPYVQNWFFSIQQQLAKETVLDLSYVGNHAVSLPIIGDYNQAFPQTTPNGTASLQSRRPDQAFGAITWYGDGGFSSYNSFQAKLEHRFSGGLYLLNSFTYSKAIDNGSQSLDTSNGNQASPQDVRNLAAERGPSNYDQTLVNTTSLVYRLPYGHGQHFGSHAPGIVDAFLGGWEITGINTAASALPITLREFVGSVPTPIQDVGNLADYRGGEAYRPNITGPVVASHPDENALVNNYFNKANVQLTNVGGINNRPYGNAGRNSVRATPFNQLDFALDKNFRLWEGGNLQFRSEFFNIFNHTNFMAPNSDAAAASFGTIRGTYPARQIQFALKLMF